MRPPFTVVRRALHCPPHHGQRCLAQLRSKSVALEKYIYLNGLKSRDTNLFYQLILDHMQEVIPILYTPTVGEACVHYSHIWRRHEGLYLSIEHKGRIRDVLAAWPHAHDARIAVVTDGSRILGLGDLGANGLPISIGKLDLYIAGAGIRPTSTVPICLDLGTNTERYRHDPLYLGVRRPRPTPDEMDAFMDEFMHAVQHVWPDVLVQWEDFSTANAFRYLDRYRHRHRVFNDDIQGTGAVVLSGFINAARLSAAASGRALADQRILFLGAGAAGVGVAKQLLSFFTRQGMSLQEAKTRIYTVDSKGLITADRKGLEAHKTFFARTDDDGPQRTDLVDIIHHVKPTALLGLSTRKGAFTKEVVEAMSALNARPILFPLSNPDHLCELDHADAIRWTDGDVIYASGSPYGPVVHDGVRYEPGQGNNMYIFPGLGLGAILAKARHVSDGMVEQAAVALASSLDAEERAAGCVYPRLTRIRALSAQIALAVIRQAQREGLDANGRLRTLTDKGLMGCIQDAMWRPTRRD